MNSQIKQHVDVIINHANVANINYRQEVGSFRDAHFVRINLKNGYSLSVVNGENNYCNNRDIKNCVSGGHPVETFEVAIFNPDDDFCEDDFIDKHNIGGGEFAGGVAGWQTIAQVEAIVAQVGMIGNVEII